MSKERDLQSALEEVRAQNEELEHDLTNLRMLNEGFKEVAEVMALMNRKVRAARGMLADVLELYTMEPGLRSVLEDVLKTLDPRA